MHPESPFSKCWLCGIKQKKSECKVICYSFEVLFHKKCFETLTETNNPAAQQYINNNRCKFCNKLFIDGDYLGWIVSGKYKLKYHARCLHKLLPLEMQKQYKLPA